MKITPTETSGLSRSFHVVVDAAELERQTEVELQSLSGKVKISGFRSGKIPMSVLKQRYGKNVMGDVLQGSIDKATRDLLEKESIRPALQPDIKISNYEEGGDLEFDITIEAMPDVPEYDFSKLSIDDLKVVVEDSEVEEGLSRLAAQRKHTHKAEAGTKAKTGDVVRIDFLGKRDGEPFSGGAANDFQLELGSGQFIPGFEEQLVGMQAGDEKTINVTFPEQYHSADLAGKPVTFDVKVHEVLYSHAAEVNEEFAKGFGFEDLAVLKNAIRDQINADYEGMARVKAKKQLFDQLDEQVKFDIPKGMYDLEFNNIWGQIEEAKKAKDESVEGKSDDELKKEYGAIAERRVRLGIILAEVGRKNNLAVTKDELGRAITEQARMYPGQEQKIFEFYKQNPRQVEELRGPILEEKAVDFILSKAKRPEKTISRDELMKSDEEATENKKTKSKKA